MQLPPTKSTWSSLRPQDFCRPLVHHFGRSSSQLWMIVDPMKVVGMGWRIGRVGCYLFILLPPSLFALSKFTPPPDLLFLSLHFGLFTGDVTVVCRLVVVVVVVPLPSHLRTFSAMNLYFCGSFSRTLFKFASTTVVSIDVREMKVFSNGKPPTPLTQQTHGLVEGN